MGKFVLDSRRDQLTTTGTAARLYGMVTQPLTPTSDVQFHDLRLTGDVEIEASPSRATPPTSRATFSRPRTT
jgi:hypothetical protein